MWLTIGLVLLIGSPVWIVVILCLKNGFNNRRCHSKTQLHGKTAVITGGSSGIGKETARDFATRGARVILACRNIEKAQKVADSIINSTGNKNVIVYQLDTSDMESVRHCAKEILGKETRVDILVNNAGMAGSPNKVMTKDGLELTMATNYYGHFLFTNLLLDLIKRSGPSRIVNVSSEIHMLCLYVNPQKLNFENGFCNITTTYAQSKLCNMLFNLELANRLKGTGVTANVLHPGTEEEGAQTTIYVSVSEEVDNVTGKFFDNCQIGSPSGKSQDADLAKRLWEVSVSDVGLEPHEMHI